MIQGGVIATASAIAWGIVYAFTQDIVKGMQPLSLLTATYVFAGLFSLVPYFLFGDGNDLIVGTLKHPYEFCFYVIMLLIAKFLMIWAVALIGATAASLVEVSYPMWIAIVLYLWKGEKPDTGTIIGGLFVFLGVAIISLTRPVEQRTSKQENEPPLISDETTMPNFQTFKIDHG